MESEPIFTKHTEKRISARKIDRDLVMDAIRKPDAIIEESECKRIFQKRISEKEKKQLLRIFINICKKPNVIITAYKTSKVGKYEHNIR